MSGRDHDERTMTSSTHVGPPHCDPWDVPVASAPWLFADLEMTGSNPETHRVVQLCLERVVGGELVGRLSSFVKPEAGIAIGNTDIHGIDEAQLQEAPSFTSLSAQVHQLLDGAVFVAHGARHDVAFLTAELSRSGFSWRCPYFIDTVSLSRRVLTTATSHRLICLAQQLGISNPRPHRADNDVTVTRALFDHLLSQLDSATPRQLWLVGRGKYRVQPEVLASAQHAVEHRQAARVSYRPSRGRPQQLLFRPTAVRTDVDPPVVLGYLLPTRGRRELRADRILTFELIAS